MKKIFWVLLFFSFVVYHLVTLTISPLPWLDEAQFSSITHSYATDGTLHEPVTPLDMDGQEITIYGPVYFFVAGTLEKVIGFGMLQYRLLPLLFGFINLFLAFLIFRDQYKPEKRAVGYFFLLLMLDPVMNASMHGGRMDLMASSFVLASVYFFLRLQQARNMNYSLIWSSLSGLSASVAMLTTPRSGILLVSIGAIAILRLFLSLRFSRFLEGMVWIVVFLLPISFWINHAFLDLKSLLAAYSGLNEGGFHHPYSEYILLGATALMMVPGMIEKKEKYFTEIVLLCIINIIGFYFFIFEVGCYYVFIVPYCCILLAGGFSELRFEKLIWLRRCIIWALLFFNIAYFVFKTYVLCIEMNQRRSDGIESFAKNNIPAGSKVVGDQMMYYAVRKNDCELQLITAFKTLQEREWDQRRNFDYDYLLVSDFTMRSNPEIVDLYVKNSNLKKLGRYEYPTSEMIFEIPGAVEYYNSYNATLYKRVKEKKH